MNFGTIQVADIFVGALNATEAYFGSEKVWEKSAPPVVEPLCFTAGQSNSSVQLNKNGTPDPISLEYSYDKNTWTDYSWSRNTGDVIMLSNVNDKVYFRAKTENQTIGSGGWGYYKFIMSGWIAASGNIQTLLKADGTRTDAPYYCYFSLFQDCQSLTSAPALPATTLDSFCYKSMFEYCQALTTAPSLPATTLANGCYNRMFYYCSSLTTAPELPATTLVDNCYESMFHHSGLTSAPELPAETLANNCYDSMFRNCYNLTTAPELPAETLANFCYEYMFTDCQNLTTAPELPATTLVDNCYDSMFMNCTSLTTAPTTLPATTLATYCYQNMFNGCTSLTTAPALPATDLSYACYNQMFYECSMLNEIKIGYTGDFSDEFSYWVSGVASSGTFYYNGSDTTEGASAIPSGWTVTPFTP